MILISYNEDNDRENSPRAGDLSKAKTLFLIYVIGGWTMFNVTVIFLTRLFIRIPYNYQKYKLFEAQTSVKSSNKNKFEAASISVNIFATNTIKIFMIMLKDYQIVYYSFLFAFTLLGLAVHPFFFCFLLTYIIMRSEILRKVLRSIYDPSREILWTFGMLIIATYFFTIFSYTVFHSDYDEEIVGSCFSLWSWLVVTLDVTYKSGGAIGGFLGSPFTDSDSHEVKVEWKRFIFDYLFNIIIALLIIQILSGIIIDKFSELREQGEEKEKDSKSGCFICGQSREDIEKKLGYGGFEAHTKYQHNLWDYLFFIAYITHKRQSGISDFTQLEHYTYDKLKAKDITWMPCYYDYEANKEQGKADFNESLISTLNGSLSRMNSVCRRIGLEFEG